MPQSASIYDEMDLLTRKVRKLFDYHARAKGMTLARARILRLLTTTHAGATQNALAQVVEVEGPTLVRMLDGLEAQGCIRREASETDRRVKLIYLTEEGARQAAEIMQIVFQFRQQLIEGLDPKEIEMVSGVIARMSVNLDALE
jgi:MarR family transcriptional regulator for hemolysin